MKKKPSGGGEAVVASGGGGGSRGILGPGKAPGLGSLSCGSGGGFWTSWSEAAAPAAKEAGTAAGGGKRAQVWGWPEPEAKRARPRGDGEGDAGGDEEEEVVAYEWRWTEAVSPEILALVLRGRVAADDVARGAAQVCRAWTQAVASPDMWGDVDIEAWCRRVNCRARADAAVRRLVARAQGTLRRLSAYRVGDPWGKLLNVLQIPMREITDQPWRSMQNAFLYLMCWTSLKRNMPPPDLPQGFNTAANKVVEEEALAVANTMPMLEQLELAYGLFSDLGLNAILTKCQLLRTLDILGCWNVRLEGDIEERCCALQSFREPWEPEYGTDSSSGGDYEVDDADSDD
ncbi:unnamed protein product [Miscanthus lutarioriparius]|uniref:F-box domain-containing protein n=1 Tax=Miscanthus lutarioriparius TaxID=422564 RepID=A0A811QNM8_9POAL|nr:unnamed protein product [Miscanthus lutarioriparius]